MTTTPSNNSPMGMATARARIVSSVAVERGINPASVRAKPETSTNLAAPAMISTMPSKALAAKTSTSITLPTIALASLALVSDRYGAYDVSNMRQCMSGTPCMGQLLPSHEQSLPYHDSVSVEKKKEG